MLAKLHLRWIKKQHRNIKQVEKAINQTLTFSSDIEAQPRLLDPFEFLQSGRSRGSTNQQINLQTDGKRSERSIVTKQIITLRTRYWENQ